MPKHLNWLLWSLFIFIVSILFIGIYFKEISNDTTNISIIVASLFYLVLFYSFINYLSYSKNIRIIVKKNPPKFDLGKADFLYNGDNGIYEKHIDNLVEIWRNNKDRNIEQDNLIKVLKSKIYRDIEYINLFSNMLITFGLIGTIIGLTISLGGLNTSIQGGISQETVEGIKMAISGMSTSFYTTLFGAVFGGVFLKIHFHNTQNLANELIDLVTIETEKKILPFLNGK